MPINTVSRVLKREPITQKELALMLGVSAAQVSKWNKGEPIPAARLVQLNELYPWSEDELDLLCGDGRVADSWKELLDACTQNVRGDAAFDPSWHVKEIAETLGDFGMDFTIPAMEFAEQASLRAAKEDDLLDEDVEERDLSLILEDILTGVVQASCDAACFAQFSANFDDQEELLDSSMDVEGIARAYGAGAWLSDSERRVLGLEEPLWETLCGETRLELLDAISSYLQKRSALGVAIKRDPFPLIGTHPEELIGDIQDEDWAQRLSVASHFSLVEQHTLSRLNHIEEKLDRLLQRFERQSVLSN